MSGLATTEEAIAAQNAGFFRFLRKPLELGALRQAVEQLIRSHFGGPLSMPPRRLPLPPHFPRPPFQAPQRPAF